MIEDFDRRFLAKLFSGHPRTLRLFLPPSHSRKRELLSSYVIVVLLSLPAERILVPCFIFRISLENWFQLIYWIC